MDALTTVPLTIAPDASARVAELGMQAELERMLEHTRQSVPDLRRIDVLLAPPYDTGDDPSIIIEATRNASWLGDDPTERDWGDWQVTTFPPDVCRHFVMLVVYGTTDAR